MKCYNYDKLGYFACECTEPKELPYYLTTLNNTYVSNIVTFIESHLMRTVDSIAVDYVARNQGTFAKYRRM